MISGLDWSGDAGDPRKAPHQSARLVTVVAHVDVAEWERLESALERARRARRLPADYVFHFSGSRPQVREVFFNELGSVPFSAHARVLDKTLWTLEYLKSSDGLTRIQREIVELLIQCPDAVVGRQTLLIDDERSKQRMIAPIKTDLNRRLEASGRPGLRKVKTCPDHDPSLGAIIQVADMIAGALHDAGSIAGPYLPRLRRCIDLV